MNNQLTKILRNIYFFEPLGGWKTVILTILIIIVVSIVSWLIL